MADTFVKVALIVIIIVLVGFLGVLTGYIVKPVTESTTTTTTLVTTQPTTTAHITTTTPEIEVVTTVPKVLCSPCFSYFVYRGHDDTYLLLRNGARTISLKGVTFSPGENIQVLHKCTQFPCDVTITYTDVGTGVQHTDSATLVTTTKFLCEGTLKVSFSEIDEEKCWFQTEVDMRNCQGKKWYVFEGDSCSGTYICTGSVNEPTSKWRCSWEVEKGTYTFTLCADFIPKDSETVSCITPTTTIQVLKTISVMAYSCNRDTDVITLTISNKGNTIIEEDEIEIYNNDKYIGTFGRTIEPGQLTINSFPGNPGQNTVEVVSPSNSARINVYCY